MRDLDVVRRLLAEWNQPPPREASAEQLAALAARRAVILDQLREQMGERNGRTALRRAKQALRRARKVEPSRASASKPPPRVVRSVVVNNVGRGKRS